MKKMRTITLLARASAPSRRKATDDRPLAQTTAPAWPASTVFEAAVISIGEVRAPHHPLRTEGFEQPAEKFTRRAPPTCRGIKIYAREFQINVGKAYQIEQRRGAVIRRTIVQRRSAKMIEG